VFILYMDFTRTFKITTLTNVQDTQLVDSTHSLPMYSVETLASHRKTCNYSMLSSIVNFASVHVRTLPIYEYLKLPIGDAPSYKMMLPSPRCEFASDTMF